MKIGSSARNKNNGAAAALAAAAVVVAVLAALVVPDNNGVEAFTAAAAFAPHNRRQHSAVPSKHKNDLLLLRSTIPTRKDFDKEGDEAASAEDDEEIPFAVLEASTTTSSSSFANDFDASELASKFRTVVKDAVGIDLGKLDFDVDLSSLSSLTEGTAVDLDAVKRNAMEGEFGERGETYTLAQAALVICILGGGIPFVGDLLMFLLGPGLFLSGLAVIAAGAKDLGPSLSPWPAPPATTGSDLVVKEGVYGQVRHPLYAGLIASCAGFSIMTGSPVRLLLTAGLAYVLDVKSDYEESQLDAAAYGAYKEQVPGKFFPQNLVDKLPWMKGE